MSDLKLKLKKIFNFEANIINKTEYNLNEYLSQIKLFRSINNNNFEEFIEKELLEGNFEFSILFEALSKQRFSDFSHIIEIEIVTERCELSNEKYTIVLNEEIAYYLDCIEVNNLDELGDRFSVNEKIQNYLHDKMEFIRLNEIKKLEAKIKNKKETKRFNFFKKASSFSIQDAFICFYIEQYEQAREIFLMDINYHEMYFYCCIMLDEIYQRLYSYYSEDPYINIRRVYFLHEYLIFSNDTSLTMYYMLNNFNHEMKYTKAIIELELATFLTDNKMFNNRVILALFNCINIFYENHSLILCLECIKEIKKHKIDNQVLIYVDDLELSINTNDIHSLNSA
ncbi:hypothetical protein COBT_001238 [Conglomerata obtusa]